MARVSIPAEALLNQEMFVDNLLPKVLDQLGCPACCSGEDILFEIESNLIDFGGKSPALLMSERGNPITDTSHGNITVAPGVSENLAAIQEAIRGIDPDRWSSMVEESGGVSFRMQRQWDLLLGEDNIVG